MGEFTTDLFSRIGADLAALKTKRPIDEKEAEDVREIILSCPIKEDHGSGQAPVRKRLAQHGLKGLPILAAMLKDDDEETRAKAAACFEAFRMEEAVPEDERSEVECLMVRLARSCIRDSSRRIRGYAISFLSGGAWYTRTGPDVAYGLTEAAYFDPDIRNRFNADAARREAELYPKEFQFEYKAPEEYGPAVELSGLEKALAELELRRIAGTDLAAIEAECLKLVETYKTFEDEGRIYERLLIMAAAPYNGVSGRASQWSPEKITACCRKALQKRFDHVLEKFDLLTWLSLSLGWGAQAPDDEVFVRARQRFVIPGLYTLKAQTELETDPVQLDSYYFGLSKEERKFAEENKGGQRKAILEKYARPNVQDPDELRRLVVMVFEDEKFADEMVKELQEGIRKMEETGETSWEVFK